jgi:hypothetical protein
METLERLVAAIHRAADEGADVRWNDSIHELAKGLLRKKIPELELALEGRVEEHHSLETYFIAWSVSAIS